MMDGRVEGKMDDVAIHEDGTTAALITIDKEDPRVLHTTLLIT
jgi:hypothetical protein